MDSKLKTKLDRIFSLYIRKSAANHQNVVRCYTCNRLENWQDTDCGHFISRSHLATRWNEKNCKVQCKSCNRFQSGCLDEFALHLIKDYGEGILETLNKQKWTPVKIDDLQIMALIKEYKEKINAL